MAVVGALIGGVFWGWFAVKTGYLTGAIALLSAAIAGIAFGLPTSGMNRAVRAIMGATFGFFSILVGYYYIYTTPIDIPFYGYSIIFSERMRFGEFMAEYVGPLDYLFFTVGIIEGAVLGAIEIEGGG